MEHTDEQPLANIGERLAYALEIRGRKANWLAGQIDAHQTSVTRWINGKREPSSSQLIPIADALEVNLRWLLSGEGDPNASDAPGVGGPSRQPSPVTPRLDGKPDRRRGVHGRRSSDAG